MEAEDQVSEYGDEELKQDKKPEMSGIIKLGTEAKYSVGLTKDEETEAKKALLLRLR